MGLQGHREGVALGDPLGSLKYSDAQVLCLGDAISDGRAW